MCDVKMTSLIFQMNTAAIFTYLPTNLNNSTTTTIKHENNENTTFCQMYFRELYECKQSDFVKIIYQCLHIIYV